MKPKFTILIMALAIMFSSCAKKEFSEQDAIAAQTQLLNIQYQHEIALATLQAQSATALQQMANQAALAQLKLNDSLAQSATIAAKKQDYTVNVVDVLTNAPIADATVTVSSQGKVYAAQTNAQGSASFTSLYLFPTSAFIVTKTGYAATQILQQNITQGSVKLWNTSNITNQISGTLYIDTNLTNNTPEKVRANVLVTATTSVPNNSSSGSYTISFPTYTAADGTYSIQVPAAPNSYNMTFGQVVANQTLYVNATQDDPGTSFPVALPRLTTVKTYFNVNNYSAIVPSVTNDYYFKVAPDNAGNVLYIPSTSYYYYYSNSQVILTSIGGGKYQVNNLNISSYYTSSGTYVDFSTYTYAPNSKINVDIVDVAGNVIQTAPLLSAMTDANGKLVSYTSPEGGTGYVHLRRDASGNLVANARGVILKAISYNSYNNTYILSNNVNLNTVASNSSSSTSILLNNPGDKIVVNYYYGTGASRDKQVY